VKGLAAKIEREHDIARVKEIAIDLDRANLRLIEEIARTKIENAKLRGEDTRTLELDLQFTKEKLAAREQALFGRSSEKRAHPDEAVPSPRKAKKTGHGPTPQPELPVETREIVLPEDERSCPSCGGPLEAMKGQFEDSDEIDVVERSFRVVVHRRQKYRCRCGECVKTAPAPEKVIPGGRYSLPFAVNVAIAKYEDHLPLARQAKQMAREGLRVSSQTLWDQLVGLEMHLESSYEALLTGIFSAPVIAADETRWPILGKKSGGKSWWAWSVATPDAVAYRILDARSTAAAKDLLGDYRGTVLCDGYAGYKALTQGARGDPRITLAHCWSHVRRKFVKAEPNYPEAAEMIDLIGDLYDVEREIREAPGADREALTRERRQAKSKPIVEQIEHWLVRQKALPRSSLGSAITYTAKLWSGLCRFLDDPRLPIDNNGLERAIRPLALGRKNHHGSRSIHGTRVAALFYSLIESAKIVGVEPRAYLLEATRRAIREPGAVTLPNDLI